MHPFDKAMLVFNMMVHAGAPESVSTLFAAKGRLAGTDANEPAGMGSAPVAMLRFKEANKPAGRFLLVPRRRRQSPW